MHGVALIEKVIAKADRLLRKQKPRPLPRDVIDKLVFPNGKPLSPALRAWLAFDAGWLGWFDDVPHSAGGVPAFAPRTLGEYARDEYEMDFGYSALEPLFPGECYGLHFGSDSRRLLYVGEPDSTGEYPVLLLDTDDTPYIGVQYPGIDVYLGIHAGVIEHDGGTYGDLIEHPVYGARMREHADRYFGGESGREVFDFPEVPPEAIQAVFADQAKELEQLAATKPSKKPAAKSKKAKPKLVSKAKTAAKPKVASKAKSKAKPKR